MVPLVGDVDTRAADVETYSARPIKLAVARAARAPLTQVGTGRGEVLDAVVDLFGDVDVAARGGYGDAVRVIELAVA